MRRRCDILVIDDNSPDGTGAWCDARRPSNEPRSAACTARESWAWARPPSPGMKYAIEHGYRYVLNMDADFSHQPKYLPGLIGRHGPGRAGRRST